MRLANIYSSISLVLSNYNDNNKCIQIFPFSHKHTFFVFVYMQIIIIILYLFLTGQPGTTSYSPSGISTAVHTAAQYAALNAVAAAAVVNGSAGTPLIISLLFY
jgi:hypothetical protein